MSLRALYPGTFDPPTNGHVDLIQRGAKLFEHLTVGILKNPVKNPLFTVEERVEMLIEATSALGNVSIATFDGLMVDFARQQEAKAVLRGIRAISDYEHEFQMALMNRRLAPEVETVFLQPAGRYSFVSSSMLKEVFAFGGDVSGLSNVSVATFDGLMVDFARQQGASAVLRGIRAISDYEYEFQMALMNRRLAPEIETVFLQPAGRYSFVSSRMLKEVFSFGGEVTGLVPPNVLKRLRSRFSKS